MVDANKQPIAILGAGSWGTALAIHLAKQQQKVRLWTYDPAHAQQMQEQQENKRYLPGIAFPHPIHVSSDLKDVLSGCRDILIAVPSVGFRDTLLALKHLLDAQHRLVWATKGLDNATGEFLHEVAFDVLQGHYAYAVLSGPSFAKEVAAGLPTAVVIASTDNAFAQQLTQRFTSNVFRVYTSNDVIGVEMGGIVKNVIAIASGISDGLQLGANARSALITRGLAEIVRLGMAVGGQLETFLGLSGVGDLVLTCTDNLSRNRRFGLALGSGKNKVEAEREIGQVIEGEHNAKLVAKLAAKYKVEMPITETVCKVLDERMTLAEAMQSLLRRDSKAEN